MKIFRTMLCTLCQNCLSYFNMQLCGFHCINRYSICIVVIFPCIFIIYCDYRVFYREFLWPTSAKKYQMGSDINILYHSYQEWLKYQTFIAFQCIFHILVNSLLTGNDMCHSQPKPQHFIISNASRSMHCSSVEAYLL